MGEWSGAEEVIDDHIAGCPRTANGMKRYLCLWRAGECAPTPCAQSALRWLRTPESSESKYTFT